MDDDPVYPPWYEMVPWLSRHKGRAAHLTCRRCDLDKAYAVDDILMKEGDIAVKSLPGLVARLLNCPHIAETETWKRCLIKAEIRDILDPAKMSPHITSKHLAAKLVCQRCGNKTGNALLYMHMPR